MLATKSRLRPEPARQVRRRPVAALQRPASAPLAGGFPPLLGLQQQVGNQQVQRLLQRAELAPQPAAAAVAESVAPPGPAELERLDPLLEAMDEAALVALLEALQRLPTAPQGTIQALRRPGVVQCGRLIKGIASERSPNLKLAGKLEKNVSFKPRLLNKKKAAAIRRKQLQRYIRKYVIIKHQNLQNDSATSDLFLVLRLGRTVSVGGRRDLHYTAIEAKSNRPRQTAQVRTELLGEAMASIRMEGYLGGKARLLIGYAAGTGIDQLWVNHSKKVYYVVEAKGPGAKLTTNVFAVRGTGGSGRMKQMSKAWVASRIPQIKTMHPAILKQLLTDCGLKIVNNLLVNDSKNPGTYTLEGLVITAIWKQDDVGSSISNKQDYRF